MSEAIEAIPYKEPKYKDFHVDLFMAVIEHDLHKVKDICQLNKISQHRRHYTPDTPVEPMDQIPSIWGFSNLDHLVKTYTFNAGDEALKSERFSPLHFAIYYGDIPIIDYFLSELKVNFSYGCIKPGTGQLSDTRHVMDEIFPLIIALNRGELPLFQYFYETQNYAWNVQHLRFIMEETVYSGNIQILSYLIEHDLTKNLFKAMAYPDRISIISSLLKHTKSIPIFIHYLY